METKTTSSATSLLDMLFEGRNKTYGAYLLRQIYHRHLVQALFMAVSGVTFLLSLHMVWGMFGKEDVSVPVVQEKPPKWVTYKLEEIKPITPEEPKAVEPAAAKPAGKTVQNVTYKVTEDHKVQNEQIPTQEDLKTANSAVVTSDGDGLGRVDDPMAGTGTGTATGTGDANAGTPALPEIFLSVEKMPEFEGGMKKLMEFVGRHLQYPRAAQNHGVEGTVVLSFVIGPTGEVADISVVKGLGYGTEEEAIRVLKKMPRWKPGIQNGQPVSVRMMLPIRLELK